jgi:hypothetical protein
MVPNRTATTTSHTVVAIRTPSTFQEWLKEQGKDNWGYDIELLKKPHIRDIWCSPQSKDYPKEIKEDYKNDNGERFDKLTIDVLKGFCFGNIPKFEFLATTPYHRSLAVKITCTLLGIDHDPKHEYFNYVWDKHRTDYDSKTLATSLEKDYIGRCLLGMHFEGGHTVWKQLIPLNLSNLSVQRMKEAGINVVAHDTQVWTLQRRALIIRKLNPNLQRLLKIYMTSTRDLSASITRLLVPYLILIANKKDYQHLCAMKVFDEKIIMWEDIERIAIIPMLLDPYIVDTLHEISNAIKYDNDKIESNRALLLNRIAIAVAVLSLLTSITSIWAAYQTQRQADAAWATISHT